MRLARLVLDSYGCFAHLDLALAAAPGRINLLVAPNGAGKSVLRQAFSDLLFGLSQRSDMTFAYPPAKLRLTAELADGGRLVRRKGRGETLTDGEAPLAAARLQALLGGADETLFRQLFSLDTKDLRLGGEALASSDGELGQMLFAGSGGLGAVQKLLGDLVAERDEFGRADRHAKGRPIWAAREQVRAAKKRLAEAALRPESWKALEQRAAETAETLRKVRQERTALRGELDDLRLAQAMRPALARRAAARAVLAETAGGAEGPEDVGERWQRAVEQRSLARATLAERTRRRDAARAAPGREPGPAALLAAAEEIVALEHLAVTARNAAGDSRKVGLERATVAQRAARGRVELGWEATQALPAAPLVRGARTLLGKREGLVTGLRSAERVAARAEAAAREAAPGEVPVAGAEQALHSTGAARQAELAALDQAEAPTDPAALHHARDARDALWDAALAGSASAALAYERALRRADALADRMIAQAGQDARIAALRHEIGEIAARLETAAAARRAAEKAAAEAGQAGRELAEARAALAAWTRDWTCTAAGLARPAGEPPEATGAALETLEQVRADEAVVAGLDLRLGEMHASIAAFEAAAARLAALLPEAAGKSSEEITAILVAALHQAREAATRHDSYRRTLAAAEKDLAEAETACARAEAAAAALRETLGAADDAAAAVRLEEVQRRRQARRELEEAEREIARHAGGRDEAALARLVGAHSDAAERERIAELEPRAQTLDSQLETAAAEARTAGDARAAVGQDSRAREAAAERESALATLGHTAGEALLRHLAAALLRTALAARDDAEGPAALRRVGTAFASLTGGAFRGVEVQEQGKTRFLTATAADETTREIGQLSEGTRDQLYLALRIAALEDYVAGAPGLPFIADDLLQTFDDDRARAAFRTLLELSEKLQVIVLTHHPHLARLAAEAVPEERLQRVTLTTG